MLIVLIRYIVAFVIGYLLWWSVVLFVCVRVGCLIVACLLLVPRGFMFNHADCVLFCAFLFVSLVLGFCV